MQGIEVILGPGSRKVYRANGFYLEQIDAGSQDGRRGSSSQLAVSRSEPKYPGTNSAETKDTVIDRIPAWCFVFKVELDEDGKAPAHEVEGTGWYFDEQMAEPDPAQPLPPSDTDPLTKLPRAPRAKATA